MKNIISILSVLLLSSCVTGQLEHKPSSGKSESTQGYKAGDNMVCMLSGVDGYTSFRFTITAPQLANNLPAHAIVLDNVEGESEAIMYEGVNPHNGLKTLSFFVLNSNGNPVRGYHMELDGANPAYWQASHYLPAPSDDQVLTEMTATCN